MDQERLLKIIGEGANSKARAETLEQLHIHGLDPRYLAQRLKALCEAKRAKSQWVAGSDGVFDKNGKVLIPPTEAGWQHTLHEDNTTQLNAAMFLADLLDVKAPKVTKNLNLDMESKMAAIVLAKVESLGQLGMDDIDGIGDDGPIDS